MDNEPASSSHSESLPPASALTREVKSEKTGRSHHRLDLAGRQLVNRHWQHLLSQLPPDADISRIKDHVAAQLPHIDWTPSASPPPEFRRLAEASIRGRLNYLERQHLAEHIRTTGGPLARISDALAQRLYPQSHRLLPHVREVHTTLLPQIEHFRTYAQNWLQRQRLPEADLDTAQVFLEDRLADIVSEHLQAADPHASRRTQLATALPQALTAEYGLVPADLPKAFSHLCRDGYQDYLDRTPRIPEIIAADLPQPPSTSSPDRPGRLKNWAKNLKTRLSHLFSPRTQAALRLGAVSTLTALGLTASSPTEAYSPPVSTETPPAPATTDPLTSADTLALRQLDFTYADFPQPSATPDRPAPPAEALAPESLPPETKISPFYYLGSVSLEENFTLTAGRQITEAMGLSQQVFSAEVKVNDSADALPGELVSWFNDWRSHPNAALVLRTAWPQDNAAFCHSGPGFPCNWANLLSPDQIKGATFTLSQPSPTGDQPRTETLEAVDSFELSFQEVSQGRLGTPQEYTADGLTFFTADDADGTRPGLPRDLWPENRDFDHALHLITCLDTNSDGQYDLARIVVLARRTSPTATAVASSPSTSSPHPSRGPTAN